MVDPIEQTLYDVVHGVLADFHAIDQHRFASQRTTADQIEHSVRSMLLAADPGFRAPQGPRRPGDVMYGGTPTFHINIKSMDITKKFHMPNLISSENLWRLLDQAQEFVILKFQHQAGVILGHEIWNIQDIDWQCLQISALGTGQIQLRRGGDAILPYQGSRDEWRRELCQHMLEFYQREKLKADRRIAKWRQR
jgi:hypothetical protein